MTTFQRARSEEQRELRRRAILDEAGAMLDELPVAEISLNELSRRVGLAKSNVLRYFDSREAILLELLEQVLASWLDDLTNRLASAVDPAASARERGDQVAATLAASLATQRVLCDLLGAQAGVLEHNVSVDVAARHKRAALHELGRLGELILRHLPELGPHGAQQVCIVGGVVIGALWTHTHPSPNMVAVYESDPSLAAMRLDFATALESILATVIAGVMARCGG